MSRPRTRAEMLLMKGPLVSAGEQNKGCDCGGGRGREQGPMCPGKGWGERQISDGPFLLRGGEGLGESTSWVKPRLETGQPGPAGRVRGSSTRVETEQMLQSGGSLVSGNPGREADGRRQRGNGSFQHVPAETHVGGRPRRPGTPRLGVHRPSTSQPMQLKPPFPKRGRDLPEVTQQAQGDTEPEPGYGPHPEPRKDPRRLPGASAAPSADPHTPPSSAGDTKGPGPGKRRPGRVGRGCPHSTSTGEPLGVLGLCLPRDAQDATKRGLQHQDGAHHRRRPPSLGPALLSQSRCPDVPRHSQGAHGLLRASSSAPTPHQASWGPWRPQSKA